MTHPNNIENITKVRDFMLKIGPEHFDMTRWFQQENYYMQIYEADKININDCGTTACIGGCGALVSGIRSFSEIIDWLGLTILDNSDGCPHLFYKPCWHYLGPIGEEAQAMSDYNGALHLLNAAIEGRLVL